MAELGIAMCCYNNLDVLKPSVDAVLANTDVSFRLLLVYNHPPYPEVYPFLESIEQSDRRVRLVDPGRNLGCHDGVNYGWNRSGNAKYLAKIDDDTIVPVGWASEMIKALKAEPRMAYLAANCSAKQANKYQVAHYPNSVTIEVAVDGIVGFSCMVMPKRTFHQLGPLKTLTPQTSLYGVEELYYAIEATNHDMRFGLVPSVMTRHQENENRDVDYVLWKYYYGYLRRTSDDYITFRSNEAALRDAYEEWLQSDNPWHQDRAKEWLETH